MPTNTRFLLSTPESPVVRVRGVDPLDKRVTGEQGGEWVTYAEFRQRLHKDRLVIRQVHASITGQGVRINGRVQSLQFARICPRCGRLLGYCLECGGYHRCDDLMRSHEGKPGPFPGPRPEDTTLDAPPNGTKREF